MREKLIELRADLVRDVALCTTRDQHIRAIQRVSAIDEILLDLGQGSALT